MGWGILIGALIAGPIALILGAALARSDDRDEYGQALEELGKALREAYAWIHVSGEWDEFSRTGFTVDPPAPSIVADAERREIRAARARARDRGEIVPLGHVRLGIDRTPKGLVPGEGRVFTRPVDPRAANPGQAPNEWGEIGRTDPGL